MSVISIQTTSPTVYKTTVTKHYQTQHIKIIKHLAFDSVSYQCFNTMFNISLMVVIQWRATKLILGSNDTISKTDLIRLRYISCCVCGCLADFSYNNMGEKNWF